MSDVAKDWVATNAARFPQAPALENADTGEVWTWRQVEGRVARLAGGLAEQFGIGPGDRVVIISEGDTRVLELQFACMRLGAIMVPLNWRLAEPELVAQCGDVEPALVAFDDAWQETALRVAGAVGVGRFLGWRCPDVEVGYDDLLDKASSMSESRDNLLSAPTHILHTSGTTGVPKGAITTAGTLTWQTFNTIYDARLTGPGAKYLDPLPLFHAGGLTTVATPMLVTGGCVAVTRRFNPEQIAGLLADPSQGITHWIAPPVMHQALISMPVMDRDLSHLVYAQVAGGTPTMALIEAWQERGVTLCQAYGGTELGPAVTSMPPDWVTRKPGSCGRPVPYTQVRLVTPEGQDAPDEEIGEVWIKGPSVTPGYWRPEVGDGTRVDGWFRTGDAARRDSDGFYYLVDRYKDMYKSGGENVYPAEVERVLAASPLIAQVAVVGVPDPTWGEVGHAFVVAREGATVTLADLADFGTGKLARYKLPKRLTVLGDLPRNTTGKVAKAELKKLIQPRDDHR